MNFWSLVIQQKECEYAQVDYTMPIKSFDASIAKEGGRETDT